MDKEEKKQFKELKMELTQIEEEILHENDNYEVLNYRMKIRQIILNHMFSIHATKNEIERLCEVNDRFSQLVKDYHKWAHYIQESFEKLHDVNGNPIRIQTELEPNLREEMDSELLKMKEDSDYGSKWKPIHEIMGKKCGTKDLPLMTENNDISMNIGVLSSIPQMKDICVNELFWRLSEKYYLSVPDIIRIQYYHYEYRQYYKATDNCVRCFGIGIQKGNNG